MPTGYEPQKPRVASIVYMVLLLCGMVVYAWGVAAIADLMPGVPLWAQVFYYTAAGILWIFPARWGLKFLRSKDQEPGSR